MLTHFKNRLLVTSLALAAAGILTCIACTIDVLFPRGSLLAFFGWMVAAGIAIVSVMVGFAWSCEKMDVRDQSRREKAEHDRDDRPREVHYVRAVRAAIWFDWFSRAAALCVAPRLHYGPVTLRGARPPTGNDHLRIRHGP